MPVDATPDHLGIQPGPAVESAAPSNGRLASSAPSLLQESHLHESCLQESRLHESRLHESRLHESVRPRLDPWTERPSVAKPAVCVVIPMYNESRRVANTVATLAASPLNRPDVALLFCDDGSSDDSAGTVLEAARAHRFARPVGVSVDTVNRGKGAAVQRGVLSALAEDIPLVAFLDADLSLDPAVLDEAIALMKTSHADVVVGKRIVDRRKQPPLRRAVSLAFKNLTAALAPTGVSDTQCACKVFRAAAAEVAFSHLATPGFAFDVEILLRVRAEKLRVVEFPLAWQHTDGSRVHPALEAYRMTRDVLRIRRLIGAHPGRLAE